MINRTPKHMVSLFAGIGGFELAFKTQGIETTLMCEIDKAAQAVLTHQFSGVPIVDDICLLKTLPDETDILCAGFPCQDLSSVGEKQGMLGSRSSLVREVFRIIATNKVEWVIFENVSFMLSLNNGEAIHSIVNELEALGYNWAYRTIDTIAFLPQHRCRVFVVASLHNNPNDVILSGDFPNNKKILEKEFTTPVGFYWTEGKNALSLIPDAIPTLKAGSTIGIASPPAIMFPSGEVSTIEIRDAERLQGFPAEWTKPAESVQKASFRWRLIGNAVSVDTVAWIASKLIKPVPYNTSSDKRLKSSSKWPKAAWGSNGQRYISEVSLYPVSTPIVSLTEFLSFPRKNLSLKAVEGFYNRLKSGKMRRPDYFDETITNYINHLKSSNHAN